MHTTYGFAHRDFKPENILISTLGAVKIGDLGLAGAQYKPGYTPRYAAPEQILGIDAAEPADVFAFGVSAYQILTRRQPFITKPRLSYEDGAVVFDSESNPAEVGRTPYGRDGEITVECVSRLAGVIELGCWSQEPCNRPGMAVVLAALADAIVDCANAGSDVRGLEVEAADLSSQLKTDGVAGGPGGDDVEGLIADYAAQWLRARSESAPSSAFPRRRISSAATVKGSAHRVGYGGSGGGGGESEAMESVEFDMQETGFGGGGEAAVTARARRGGQGHTHDNGGASSGAATSATDTGGGSSASASTSAGAGVYGATHAASGVNYDVTHMSSAAVSGRDGGGSSGGEGYSGAQGRTVVRRSYVVDSAAASVGDSEVDQAEWAAANAMDVTRNGSYSGTGGVVAVVDPSLDVTTNANEAAFVVR